MKDEKRCDGLLPKSKGSRGHVSWSLEHPTAVRGDCSRRSLPMPSQLVSRNPNVPPFLSSDPRHFYYYRRLHLVEDVESMVIC